MKLSLLKILESHVLDQGISEHEAVNLAKQLNIDFEMEGFSFDDFVDGANHEIEHGQTVQGSPSTVARIAVDHLREDPQYYQKLKGIES